MNEEQLRSGRDAGFAMSPDRGTSGNIQYMGAVSAIARAISPLRVVAERAIRIGHPQSGVDLLAAEESAIAIGLWWRAGSAALIPDADETRAAIA